MKLQAWRFSRQHKLSHERREIGMDKIDSALKGNKEEGKRKKKGATKTKTERNKMKQRRNWRKKYNGDRVEKRRIKSESKKEKNMEGTKTKKNM
jgi:hypothetical protein